MRTLYRDNIWFAGKAVRMLLLTAIAVGFVHTATEWKDGRAERVASAEADDTHQHALIEKAKRTQVSNELASAVSAAKRAGMACSVKPALTNHILAMGVRAYGTYINDTVYTLTFDEAWKEAHAGNVWILSYCASAA